jgi:hypothetical protein
MVAMSRGVGLNTAMLVEVGDIYDRVRERGPTLDDEICSCSAVRPIMVMSALGTNPLHCLSCNLEVEPGTLPLPEAMVDAVVHWAWVASAIHGLELDSGPYEQWAQVELGDLGSPIDREGLELRSRLDPIRRCYSVLFQPLAEEGFVVPHVCPGCGVSLTDDRSGLVRRAICERCSVVLVNP